MTLPKNVLWFEVLLYLALIMDALSVAFQDRTPNAEMTEQMISVNAVMVICLILLLAYFVHLAGHRRKNWPRWVLGAMLVLSAMTMVQLIAANGVQLDSVVDITSSALAAAGLYFSFTGDAVGWFNA
jgi:hypothetical protein